VFINLKKNFASLYQKLLVIRTLLQCNIRIIQCLLVLFGFEVGLTDAIIYAHVSRTQFKCMEEIFDGFVCLVEIVLS
jgi:hypothetical protein